MLSQEYNSVNSLILINFSDSESVLRVYITDNILMFQALADRIAIPCSLVRGEYNRAWNEVLLAEERETVSVDLDYYLHDSQTLLAKYHENRNTENLHRSHH